MMPRHQVGSGPLKVLWLHDVFGSAGDWGPMVDALDGGLFSHVFMDARGYGSRKLVPGEFTLEEVAADAMQLVDALAWNQFSVLGHGVGAQAAAALLLRMPQRVRRLVALTPMPLQGWPLTDAELAFHLSAAQQPDARRHVIDQASGGRLPGPWLTRMVQQSMAVTHGQAFSGYVQSSRRSDLSAGLRGRTLPVLAVLGAQDGCVAESTLRDTWSEVFPQTRFELFQDVGHYPMFEAPLLLAARVERFLSA